MKQDIEDIKMVILGIALFTLMYLIGIFLAGVNIFAPGNELYLLVASSGLIGPFYVIISDRI